MQLFECKLHEKVPISRLLVSAGQLHVGSCLCEPVTYKQWWPTNPLSFINIIP